MMTLIKRSGRLKEWPRKRGSTVQKHMIGVRSDKANAKANHEIFCNRMNAKLNLLKTQSLSMSSSLML